MNKKPIILHFESIKNFIKPNKSSGKNLFEKNSFQAFTEMKFKDMIVN